MVFSCVILRWMHLAGSFFMVCCPFLGSPCMYVNYVSYVVFPCFSISCGRCERVFDGFFKVLCMNALFAFLRCVFQKRCRFLCNPPCCSLIFARAKTKKSVLINYQTMENAKRKTRRTLFEYRDDRSRELLHVFNEELGRSSYDNVVDVLRRVVSRPCSRFWVSEERAFRIVSSMRRRPLPSNYHPLKRAMYEEINRRCEQLSLSHPDWPLSRCVYHVVSHEAPKFYLSVASAHALICKERNRCRVAHLLKLRRLLSA